MEKEPKVRSCECLKQVEIVSVERPRIAAPDEVAGELEEGAKMPADVEIGIRHHALYQVAGRDRSGHAPVEVAEVFVPLANVDAEGQIDGQLAVEHEVLQRIPHVRATARITQERIVLLVAHQRDGAADRTKPRRRARCRIAGRRRGSARLGLRSRGGFSVGQAAAEADAGPLALAASAGFATTLT